MSETRPNPDIVEREWLDLRGAARYVAVSERTLREWIHRGHRGKCLPASQIGKKILINRRKLDAWLEGYEMESDEAISRIVNEVVQSVTR